VKDERPYKPIACDYVDYIEHLATLRQKSVLVYRTGEEVLTRKDERIKTWENRAGVEYMIMRSGLEIRLDDIISINGKSPDGTCDL